MRKPRNKPRPKFLLYKRDRRGKPADDVAAVVASLLDGELMLYVIEINGVEVEIMVTSADEDEALHRAIQSQGWRLVASE